MVAEKVMDMLGQVTVEPCIMLFALGNTLISVQMSNLQIEKSCKVGSYFFSNGTTYANEVCENLSNGSFSEEQKQVQKITANVDMYSDLMKQIPLMVFALFLGPWSDQAGRKLLIAFPFFGNCLTCLGFLVNVYFFDQLYVEFLWIGEVVGAMFGYWVIFFLGVYGYVADNTSVESRTLRISIADGCYYAMASMGNYVNGLVYKRFSYYGNFGFALLAFAAGFLLAMFQLKETKKDQSKDEKEEKGLVSLENLTNSFKVLVKRREGSLRHIVILLVAAFMCGMLGYTRMDYLYLRRKFTWENDGEMVSWYTQLQSFLSIGQIFSLFLVLPLLLRFLKLHDMTIVLLAGCSMLIQALLYFFATSTKFILATIFFNLFAVLFSQPLRSSMTKIVGEGDVGAVFACVGSLQAVFGFLSPLYNKLYAATLDWNPGAVYLVASGFYLLMILIALYILIFLKGRKRINSGQDTSLVSLNHTEIR